MKDIKKYDKEHWGAVSVDLNMAHVDGILENGISKNEQLIPTGELGPGRAEVNPAGQVLVWAGAKSEGKKTALSWEVKDQCGCRCFWKERGA